MALFGGDDGGVQRFLPVVLPADQIPVGGGSLHRGEHIVPQCGIGGQAAQQQTGQQKSGQSSQLWIPPFWLLSTEYPPPLLDGGRECDDFMKIATTQLAGTVLYLL